MSLSTPRGCGEALTTLDETDRRILAIIQAEFPLCRRPYRDIARRAGMPVGDVLERVRNLRRRGIIRRIGGVLDSRRLGLVGTLVALRVPTDRIDEVAAIINALPNVTHNYLREHDYNMWFTVTAGSREEVAAIVERLRRETSIDDLLDLPSEQTYKINVRLDFDTDARPTD